MDHAAAATTVKTANANVYVTVGTLAQGGMGTVDVVVRREGRFERWHARKRLTPQLRDDPAARAMFMDEARLAGMLRHPNVVSVVDASEDHDGPFLIMDFVEGVPLSRLIAHAAETKLEIPLQVCMRIIIDAARGLHAAHELRDAQGARLDLVHRDVSAHNILVGFDGSVRVSDFGIAKALGNVARTKTGVLKGNLGYLSPEQLRFEEPDRRSDLFSLGVCFYELLAGTRLYTNEDSFEGARRILNEPPPDVGEVRVDVSDDLTALLFQLMAKQPDLRPSTAEELANRIEAMLGPCVDAEGVITVADHMSAHFEAEKRAQGEMLARRLNEIRAAESSAMEAADARRPRRRWRGWALAGVILSLGFAALAVLAARHRTAIDAGPSRIWAGGQHTCALERGALFCWGRNTEGALGIQTTKDAIEPRQVMGLTGVESMGLGAFHTCACTREGRVFCWGRNVEGQLGLGIGGRAFNTSEPKPVPLVNDCVQISAGPYHACALAKSGAVVCWGANPFGGTGQTPDEPHAAPRQVPGLSGVVEIAAGGNKRESFTCARLADGTVRCWGYNGSGQLGDGTTISRHHPAPVADLEHVEEVAVGGAFACARIRGGGATCWGRNDRGQLGDGTTADRSTATVPVQSLTDAIRIAAGREHACALLRSRAVVCWGANNVGQLGSRGNKDTTTPAKVAEVSDATDLVAGFDHGCVGLARGMLCWGSNKTGQLGDGTRDSRSHAVSVAGIGR